MSFCKEDEARWAEGEGRTPQWKRHWQKKTKKQDRSMGEKRKRQEGDTDYYLNLWLHCHGNKQVKSTLKGALGSRAWSSLSVWMIGCPADFPSSFCWLGDWPFLPWIYFFEWHSHIKWNKSKLIFEINCHRKKSCSVEIFPFFWYRWKAESKRFICYCSSGRPWRII